ncbi:hypothetical protein ACCO45_008472 [Purpureocillium lilacinum]|uniref:Uncharacterized protein n=1 Tax=Purpureocillium lilacinum TaxID=33203 RepID=A0ACC4DPT9_PURLI
MYGSMDPIAQRQPGLSRDTAATFRPRDLQLDGHSTHYWSLHGSAQAADHHPQLLPPQHHLLVPHDDDADDVDNRHPVPAPPPNTRSLTTLTHAR